MPKAIIHLLIPVADGPIKSQSRHDGTIQSLAVACDPKHPTLPKHATGEVAAATCPLCIASDAGKAVAEAQKPGESEIDRRAREALMALEAEAEGCAACENG